MVRRARTFARLLALLPLAACIESDPPALSAGDLVEDVRLSDRFIVVPAAPQPADAPQQTALGFRGADGTYQFLQFQGTLEVPQQLWSSGNQVRIIRLSADQLLVISVYWDQLFSGDVYSIADMSDPKEFRLLKVDLGKAALDESFVASIKSRLGVTLTHVDGIEDDSGVERTHIESAPDAATLRALFTDSEFLSRMSTKVLARLRPFG
jgi:hypothetical protein